MTEITRITFLIHPFCYACGWGGELTDRNRRYFEREERCAEGWLQKLGSFGETDALAIIPAGTQGAAGDFFTTAQAKLGERFFMLDVPDPLSPSFWQSTDADFKQCAVAEMQDALIHQQMAWNKEELHTALHSLACCRLFSNMLDRRRLSFDARTVTAQAWGASFDGCVTKYSLSLRRMLGLCHAIEIDFDLTVPDAFFLLDAALTDEIFLGDGLRLFLFEIERRMVGLYTFTDHSLADQPALVFLEIDPGQVLVKSKQGLRLYPHPQPYRLKQVPFGYEESPQTVVRRSGKGLIVPASAGMVYRLAKAPAYIFLPEGMGASEAQAILSKGVRMKEPSKNQMFL